MDAMRHAPSELAGDLSAPATSYDVVVVGAGPAGSGVACALATQGWRVLVVERDRFPRHKVCGEFLSPEAQGSLAALGVFEPVAALKGVPIDKATVTTATGQTLDAGLARGGLHTNLASREPAVAGRAWGISRYALDATLAAAAHDRGVDVRTRTTVTGWEPVAAGMAVRMRAKDDPGGAELCVQARAVVMAGGRRGLAHPPVRDQRRRELKVGFKAHYHGIAMPSQVELYLFAGGYVGINPVENGRANVCGLASYAALARAGLPPGARTPRALIEAAERWNPALGARLAGTECITGTECAVAPVHTQRRGQAWDGVPLVGDAAAMIPPFCGDGMAMALRSAQLCAPLVDGYLRATLSWAVVGERYSHLWHREFDHRLRIGRMLERMLIQPVLARTLIGLGRGLPGLVAYCVRATRGVVPDHAV